MSSRNIDEISKQYLNNWSVCSSGHPDLYIPFFEIGLKNLKNNGRLGFITMNTFFKSINGRALRQYIQENQFKLRIVDFGGTQIFNSKSTYTCICLFQNCKAAEVEYTRTNQPFSISSKMNFFLKVDYGELDSYNGWNLQNSTLINKIETIGTPLGKKFKTRNGIATLKNDVYIFDPVDEDRNYYYLQNGSIYPIEKEACKEIINTNKLTKIDCIQSIKMKIIFPYYYEGDDIKLISESQFRREYPFAYKYLKSRQDILSTRDKGNGQYKKWYAYGRNQSLEKSRHKLFFPHIASNIPHYIINNDENLLFHNGMAIIGENDLELFFLKKILSSRLFWFYIINSSKPYGSGYFSLSRNYIKNFGLYPFSNADINYLINETDKEQVDSFIESKYEIKLNL